MSRFLRFFKVGDNWRADRCLQPCIESARMRKSVLHLFKLISPSNVPSPVALPVAKSMVSDLTIVNVPVAPANRPVPFSIVATSVILCGIWWNEDTFNTDKCARQLVAIRRSEVEGPRRRIVGLPQL